MLLLFGINKRNYKIIKENKKLIILNLHKVSNQNNPFYPSLTPKLFEALLRFIHTHFNVITFSEIKKYKNSKKPNIILSFDDGFYDFYKYAMPLLAKYNTRVNLNVIPQCIEHSVPMWDVMIGDFLNQTPIKIINQLNFPNFNMKLNRFNRNTYALALTAYLKNKSKKLRTILWLQIENLIKKEDIILTQMLDKDDIITISKIHEVGVHSYSHESMGLESQIFFEEDFFKCKKYFQSILKIPLNIYAFPNGSYKKEQITFLEEQKITAILLVNNKYAEYNNFFYNRFTLYGDSISEIKCRAVGWTR